MNVILNLRGGGGSGKTTTFRKFLDLPGEAILGKSIHFAYDKQEIKGYLLETKSIGLAHDIFLMGSYEAKCGGTDKIKTQQEICDRAIEWHKKHYHVLFEGLLVSKLGPSGTVTKALVDYNKDATWFLFLNTPAELCLERVLSRRAERGDDRPFDPDKSLFKDHRATFKCKENMEAAGIKNTGWVRHDNAYNEVLAMLKWSERQNG